MKKNSRVLREILYRVFDKGEFFMSQKSLAGSCSTSMDTVNRVASKLNQFAAIDKKPFGFRVAEPRKVLMFWATTRSLSNDVLYATYSPDSVSEIEEDMPEKTIFTAFSGYHKKFGRGPTGYDEVYVYADVDEVKRRFPESTAIRHNIFVLQQDQHLTKTSKGGVPPIAQMYVDLWQIGGGPANRHLLELDQSLEAKPVDAFKRLIKAGNHQA
jgi:hypothetical protein